jgi:hypothetical protein
MLAEALLNTWVVLVWHGNILLAQGEFPSEAECLEARNFMVESGYAAECLPPYAKP